MTTKTAIESELVREFVGNAHGSLEQVQQLLEKEPALVNAAWDWGGGDWETALGAAAHMGQREIARYLLDHGARLDIFAAAMLGETEIVDAILADFPATRNARGPHGIPLIEHARVGGAEATEVIRLLEEGPEGKSEAFFEAIKTGDKSAIETLIALNPDLIHARTEDGIGPVALAKYYREDQVADLLIEHGAELDPFTAVILGRDDAVRAALTAKPAIVRDYSSDGWTLLHLAAYFGHGEIARMLVDARAEVEARSTNDQGNTPLHAALPNQHLEIVELLLARGADVNATQEGGLTPLHEAALIGDVATARLLLDWGANPRARTNNGETPLDLARERDQHEVVRLLQTREAGS